MIDLCYLVATTHTERRSITIENLSQILDLIKSLSAQLFVFRTNAEPLALLNDIPEHISAVFTSPDLSVLLSECELSVRNLIDFLSPLTDSLHSFTHSKKSSDPMIPYADFTVDKAPVIHTASFEQLSAEDILAANPVKPVNRRSDFSFEGSCPWCGADNKYLYHNNGNAGRQYACKVCKHTFTDKVTPRDTSGFYCPHCNNKLQPHHERKGYTVYVCGSRKCPYYKANKARNEEGEALDLLTSSKQFRYHYHYRQFRFNMADIRKLNELRPDIADLSRIHADSQTLALVLTYAINYAMSSRKVSNVLRDIHGIHLSHQTILNYIHAVSTHTKDMVDFYPYDLSHTQCGDETYVHINGRNHYVFFFSDPAKKIITSYRIYASRDTENAVSSMWNVIRKFSDYPNDLSFITDGNPIYNAAQLFFEMEGYKFDLHQVIGVKNKDSVSKEYRPFKQIEERMNRTFKENYHYTNGYGSLDQANSYMVLYVTFFNFLRRHSSLNYTAPVHLSELDEFPLMTDKWLKLIELSQQYHPQSLN